MLGIVYTAPSLAEIRLALAEKEQTSGVESGTTSWLAEGIHIEELQYVLFFLSFLTLCTDLIA